MIETKLVEKKEIVDGLEIKYMFKPATLDVEHLIVIFSGYGGRSLFTYDFAGDSLIKDIPSNILWIKDEFGGAPCYYLCKHRDFSIEEKVIKFIDKKINELSLCKDDVTILGASKGGTAALYFGIKYHFKNVISSAPQLDLGSFLVAPVHKSSFDEMADSNKKDNVEFFNNVIYSEILENGDSDSYIYLFYSKCDMWQDYEKVVTILRKLYKNFSQINVDTPLVTQHNGITSYSLFLIKSILLQNAYKYSPNFRNIKIGLDENNKISERIKSIQPISESYLENIEYNSKSLQMKIVNMHRFWSENNKASKYYLCLENNIGVSYKFELKEITIKGLEKKYFLYAYYDTSNCCFELLKPLDLSSVPPQLYNCYILKNTDGKEVKSSLISINNFNVLLNRDNGVLGKLFVYRDNTVKIYVSTDISKYEPDMFKITKRFINKSSFLYEGIFIKYGLLCDDYSDLDYYMVFLNIANKQSIKIRIGKYNNPKLMSLFNGECFISKCAFTSIGAKILELGKDLHLSNGEYEIFVSMLTLSHVFSYKFARWKIEDNIIISESMYAEIKDNYLTPDLDKHSVSELMLMNEQLVVQRILDYINNINNTQINFLKVMKVRQYLVRTEKIALLNYLQFALQKVLQDDLYEKLK